MKLNPGEEVKYGEYWAQAVGDNETVGGKEAVAFLGRAEKVSKGQLRRIWDIADHRKEGALGRDEFYIALRLVGLAQRGAELSVAGLRNFSGINLIPNIAPEVKEEPAAPASAAAKVDVFSWTVPADVVAKYDSFFKSLDVRNMGMIDGKQGVTFFGKSGLPRPTLKKIWELADVTRDGKLSLDEFRSAMHMISNIRNERLTVTALPSVLDPSGPNWLRIEVQDAAPVHGDGYLQRHGHQPSPGLPVNQPPMQEPAIIPGPLAQTFQPPPPPPPPQQQQQQQSQPLSPSQTHPQPVIQPQPHQQTPPPPPAEPALTEPLGHMQPSREAEQMKEALRRERMEVERARREMDEMKAEMERLRLEKASMATAQAAVQAQIPVRSADPYGQHRSSRPSPTATSVPAPTAAVPKMHPPSVSPQMAPRSGPIVLGPPGTPPTAPRPAPTVPVRTEPISLGNVDDDDIWDQPSPKASALPGPAAGTAKRNATAQSKDSVSSDDDDDFWGGLGAKPTLGPAGGQRPGTGQGGTSGQGFGGSELDDWVF